MEDRILLAKAKNVIASINELQDSLEYDDAEQIISKLKSEALKFEDKLLKLREKMVNK